MRCLLVEARIEHGTTTLGAFITRGDEPFHFARYVVLDVFRIVIVQSIVADTYEAVAGPIEVRDNLKRAVVEVRLPNDSQDIMSHAKSEDVRYTVLPLHDEKDQLWRKPEQWARRGVCFD